MKKPMLRVLGGWAVFFSAFCFYFSTVVIRWAQSEVSIAPAYFVFARLLLGFLVVLAANLFGDGLRDRLDVTSRNRP